MLQWCCAIRLSTLIIGKKGMKRGSFVTERGDKQEVHRGFKLYPCKSPLMAYCGVTKWEHINQFGHVHADILSNVWAVSWIWDKTEHAPITHTHQQRWRDKDGQGQKVFFLVNLGCDYRVWRRENLSMKSILRSSKCQQQQFSPSELIGPSVAALCCWTKPIGEDKRGKWNEKRLQGADMESKNGITLSQWEGQI